MNKPTYINGMHDDDDDDEYGGFDEYWNEDDLQLVEQTESQWFASQVPTSQNQPQSNLRNTVEAIRPTGGGAVQSSYVTSNNFMSPSVPAGVVHGDNNGFQQNHEIVQLRETQRELGKLKADYERLLAEKQTLLQDKLQKDGEISMIRRSLNQTGNDNKKLQAEVENVKAQFAQEKEELMGQYQREIEKLRTSAQFELHQLLQEKEDARRATRAAPVSSPLAPLHQAEPALQSAPVVQDATMGMPDDYESSPSNYIGMDDAVTIPEATIIEQPHVAVETVTKPTAINGPPNYIIGEPPTMMFIRRLLADGFFADMNGGEMGYTSLSEFSNLAPAQIAKYCARKGTLPAELEKSYHLAVIRLAKNISKLMVDTSINLIILLPDVDDLLGLCLEHSLYRPMPFLLRLLYLLVLHSDDCRGRILRSNESDQPSLLLQHFQKLVHIVALSVRQTQDDVWEGGNIFSARYLYAALSILADGVSMAELARVKQVLSEDDLMLFLDNQQPAPIRSYVLEFCIKLLADSSFVDMVLDQRPRTEGRRSILQRICGLLYNKPGTIPDQFSEQINAAIVHFLSCLAAKYRRSIPLLASRKMGITVRLIMYAHAEYENLFTDEELPPPHRLPSYMDTIKLLRTLLLHPSTASVECQVPESYRYIFIATLTHLMLYSSDRPDIQEMRELARETLQYYLPDSDIAIEQLGGFGEAMT